MKRYIAHNPNSLKVRNVHFLYFIIIDRADN